VAHASDVALSAAVAGFEILVIFPSITQRDGLSCGLFIITGRRSQAVTIAPTALANHDVHRGRGKVTHCQVTIRQLRPRTRPMQYRNGSRHPTVLNLQLVLCGGVNSGDSSGRSLDASAILYRRTRVILASPTPGASHPPIGSVRTGCCRPSDHQRPRTPAGSLPYYRDACSRRRTRRIALNSTAFPHRLQSYPPLTRESVQYSSRQ
jgi:hypothetical protein